VEIFSDQSDEGRIYEGTTTADTAGHFAFTKSSELAGLCITATATDDAGNTSSFSTPRLACNWLYLPLISRSSQP